MLSKEELNRLLDSEDSIVEELKKLNTEELFQVIDELLDGVDEEEDN